MFLNKMTRSIFAVVVLLVCLGAYYFKSDNDLPIIKKESIVKNQDERKNNTIEPLVKSKNVDSTLVTEQTDIPKLKDYDEEWCLSVDLTQDAKNLADSEYKAWAESRNHVVGDRATQVESYKYYDRKVLEELGEQGDLIALAAIVDSDNFPEEIKAWAAKKAAIYGGTGDAVSYFSIQNKGLSKALMFSGKTEEAKNALLESIAWDEFSALRGDTSLFENIAFILSFEEMKELEISKEDESWISQRAQQIYSELSKERALLGLAPFDNSVPKVIEVDNARNVAFALKHYEVSNEWISKYYPSSTCVEKSLANMSNR